MPWEEQPVRGGKSATISVAASDTAYKQGADFVADGTCDEVEINNAIASLPALGGEIYLCEGTYNVCGPIIIDKDNITIIGAGASTVIRVTNNRTASMNAIEATNHDNLLVKDLRIDGNQANQPGAPIVIHGILFDTVTHSKMESCWIENMSNHGIYLNSSDHNTLIGNTCRANVMNGFNLNGSSFNTINSNISEGNLGPVNGIGIVLFNSSNNNIVTGNTCEGNYGHGIALSTSCTHNTISDNTIVNNGLGADVTYDGINVDLNCDYNDIQGNTVRTTTAAPPPNRQQYGINIAAATCDGNLVANNDLHQSGQTAGYNDAGTDTRGTVTGEVSPTGDTLVVAASNSIDPVRADYYCDGASDETEINLAIAALGATGGTVKLLEGTFTVDGNIELASNVALVGQGAGTVITIPDGYDAGIDIIRAMNKTRVLVKDLRLDGNKANQTAGIMRGIFFIGTTYSKVVNCWVEDMYSGAGINLYNASDYNTVVGNTCTGNGYEGIVVNTSDNNILIGNTCQGNDEDGIEVDHSDHNTIADNEIVNNSLVADNTHDGIEVEDSDYNNVQGNTIRTTTAAPPPNRQRYGINVSDAASDGNLVKNNDLHQSGQTGAFNDAGTNTRLPSIMVPIFDDSDANASLGNYWSYISIIMADGFVVSVRFNFRVPDDFHQLVRARIVVIPEGAGDLNWGANAMWGACDELYNAHTGLIAVHTRAVTNNELECLNINAVLAGIAAGDHVGVQFNRDSVAAADTVNAEVNVLQFWMQYV